MPILLSEQDVRIVLTMDDLIETMETALAAFARGTVVQPLRAVVPTGAGLLASMPAFVSSPPALGTKLVTVFNGNAASGLHSHLATIVLLDPDTGELLAVMDGRYITEARTAAVSAVSAKWIARKDAGVLAVIGSGVQARSHVEALTRVRTIRETRVWSPNDDRRAAFVREMRHRTTGTLAQAASVRDAVEGADLIVLATASREPVLRGEWVSPGAHICAVGACRPSEREMDTALVKQARLFVDSRVGAFTEAGDIVIPIKDGAFDQSHVAGELGQVVAGEIAGRTSADEVTIFKSLGMAVEDVAAAHLAYTRAAGRGLGRGFVL
jgi:ornithine cyclodeaminase